MAVAVLAVEPVAVDTLAVVGLVLLRLEDYECTLFERPECEA